MTIYVHYNYRFIVFTLYNYYIIAGRNMLEIFKQVKVNKNQKLEFKMNLIFAQKMFSLDFEIN